MIRIAKALPLALPLLLLASEASAEVLGIGKKKVAATIISKQGLPIGKAIITESKKTGTLKVAIAVKGLTRGEHGIHIHTVGQCTGPDFTSAGAHWNPHGKMHGLSNTEGGAHLGDMPNLLVGKRGKGKIVYDVADGTLYKAQGMMDGDGAAIVIHALSDDGRTDPSGNSGERIACGVFQEK